MARRKRTPGTLQSYANNKKAARRIAQSLAKQGYPRVGIIEGKKYKYEVRTAGRAKKGKKSFIVDFTR